MSLLALKKKILFQHTLFNEYLIATAPQSLREPELISDQLYIYILLPELFYPKKWRGD